MSELRGRVRKAPPIDVGGFGDADPVLLDGGWRAEIIDAQGRTRETTVWATQPIAFEGALRMLRWFDRYGE